MLEEGHGILTNGGTVDTEQTIEEGIRWHGTSSCIRLHVTFSHPHSSAVVDAEKLERAVTGCV